MCHDGLEFPWLLPFLKLVSGKVQVDAVMHLLSADMIIDLPFSPLWELSSHCIYVESIFGFDYLETRR